MVFTQQPRNAHCHPTARRLFDRHDCRNIRGSSARLCCPLSTCGGRADSRSNPTRELTQCGCLAVRCAQGESAEVGVRKFGCEATECIGLATAKSVGRDIWITERDDGNAAPREGAKQHECRLRCLLHVIDDNEPQSVDPFITVFGERGCCELHEFCRIEREPACDGEIVPVFLYQLGGRRPLGVLCCRREFAQFRSRDPVFGRSRHDLTQLGPKRAQPPYVGTERLWPAWPSCVCLVPSEQLTQLEVLLATGDQPQVSARLASSPPDDLESERVDSAGERAIGRPTDANRQDVAQSRCRHARRREHDQLLRAPAPTENPVGNEFNDRRGLAGAWRTEHRCGFGVSESYDGCLRRIERDRWRVIALLPPLESDNSHGTKASGSHRRSVVNRAKQFPRWRTPPKQNRSLSYSVIVDIRIGITNSPRELSFESAQTAAEVEELITAGLQAGSVKLVDNKGKVFIVPATSFAYCELGSEAGRRVGFVA
jgi:hypothetical protein